MKIAIVTCLLSFSALAQSTCFTRATEIETQEVALARTVCIDQVVVQTDKREPGVFISFSTDESKSSKTAALRYGMVRADGTVAYKVQLESSSAGGFCGDTWLVSSSATIVMNQDGTEAKVEAVTGKTSFSGDNCHSGFQVVQELNYTQN